jgi:hypothetical protein
MAAKVKQAPMSVTIKAGRIIIDAPMNDEPKPSASGKTLVVASSHGNQSTDCEVDGKSVTVGFNAYIYADKK